MELRFTLLCSAFRTEHGGRMPYSPNRIKFLINEEGETLTSLAALWRYRLEEVSQCVRQVRVYPQLRILISDFIHQPVERVFGRHALTDALLPGRNVEAGKQRVA